MATYAIGDIQGCFEPLQQLLQTIRFNPQRDTLWLAGDLVNRGPGSLEVLRWAYSQRDALRVVLGNHDLHLLAVDAGHGKHHDEDTLQPILAAPDKPVLLDWLRRQKLVHRENGWLMVHAGLLPQWTADDAQRLAREVEARLQADDYRDFLRHMYGNKPGHWSALGLRLDANLCALDSGCLWGGDLTALRLEDRQVLQVSCRAAAGTRRWQ